MTGQENEMTVADSNVILRLLLGDVPHQSERATNWLGEQPELSVLIADAVLVEVLFLLESKRAYGIARADFIPMLLRLLRSAPWRVSSLTMQALTLFENSKLDYVDCLLWAMQDNSGVSAVATFDKELQKQLNDSVL